MNVISVLKADHRKVEDLFKQVEALTDRAHVTRGKLFEDIREELTAHSEVEENIFYPAFKARTKRDTPQSDEVLEAFEEHANVKAMLDKLSELDPEDETFNPKLTVLMELVKHHVKEEETQLFKQAKELLNDPELEDLAEKVTAEKERLTARQPAGRH